MTKQLQLPYFSQLDNRYNPYGSCNVTAMAMCLWYLGIRGDGSERQLEDQLYQRCLDKGWSRHSPHDLKALVETYPHIHDDFTDRGSLEDIRAAIDQDQPCVIHGYFTRFGHIIAVKGYDDNGLIVNDPYGEYFASGYDTNRSGEGLRYSYPLIKRLCSPESQGSANHIWLHCLWRA